MTLLEFLEKFAGPMATVIASITAAGVAIGFGVVQARIARSQAKTADAQKEIAKANLDIAFDKLKHDLFDKRYEIYTAAKKLIETIFNQSPVNDADPEIKKLRLKLDEARFFFPPDTRAFCEHIEKQVYDVLVTSRAASGYSEDRPERVQLRDQQATAEIALSNIYGELAKRFERDLGFEQLTRSPAGN
jgi:hypothetical protein